MAKLSKKQRVALKEIDKLSKERKRNLILGVVSILLVVLMIFTYNQLTYSMGIISESNVVIRAILYIVAMVVAGYCGIMFMKASQKKRKIDGFRQQAGISREMLDGWQRGEYENQ